MATGQQLVDAARKYLGVKYVFGGTTKSGLDCSGLIIRALEDLEVRGGFPRVSGDQIKACTPVSVQEALDTPGALVWFDGHDALTLGDGKSTIEAVVNPGNKVAIFNAPTRWKKAGLIPGIEYGKKADSVATPRMSSPVDTGGRISSHYGWRTLNGRRVFHAGADFPAPVGTTVRAVYAGTVEKVIKGRKHGQAASSGTVLAPGRSPNGVIVRNPDGNRQLYGHVTPSVKAGDRVGVGDPVGKIDLSGITTGGHVHLEIWANDHHGSHRDPLIDFRHFGVKAGGKPYVPASRPSKPAPSKPSTPAKGNAAVLKRQRDLNRYAKAGLVEDGVHGPVMKAWDTWVRDAQGHLNAFKSSKPKLIVDDHYGPVMAAYVGDVQKRNRLVADRNLGPVTIAFMRRHGSKIKNRPKNRP